MKRSQADESAGALSAFDPVAEGILDEQLAYYRARAPEYDRWFNREGRYDRGDAETAAWRSELDLVRAQLDALELDGADVLELAAGTGLWTAELVTRGARVTAVDAAPEMLAELAMRPGNDRVTVVEADLFAWRVPRAFDAVVACFFMSHVPDERFSDFVTLVRDSLQVGGTLFLLDGQREEASTAADHRLPDGAEQTMQRRLDDGRTFQIVKRFRSDEELGAAFVRQGFDVRVHRTPRFFQMLVGTREGSVATS